MYLDAKLFSNVFKTLTESLVVWNCDGGSEACVSYKIYSVIEKINYKFIKLQGLQTNLKLETLFMSKDMCLPLGNMAFL